MELHCLRILLEERLQDLRQVAVPEDFAVVVQLHLQLLALLDLSHLSGLGEAVEALEGIRPGRRLLRLTPLHKEAADHPKRLLLAGLALRSPESLLRLLGQLR